MVAKGAPHYPYCLLSWVRFARWFTGCWQQEPGIRRRFDWCDLGCVTHLPLILVRPRAFAVEKSVGKYGIGSCYISR